jgi:asparagine synthase (glutamine-hydrolysing)
VEQSGLNSILISGDDTWPLSDLETWPINPNTPLQNLYRRLISRAYRGAREAGTTTVLTGADGDWLYSADPYWLRDLLSDHRFREAFKFFAGELIQRASTLRSGSPALRSTLARALGRKSRGRCIPDWLTPYARRLLVEDSIPPSNGPMERPEQARQLVGARAAYGTGQEVANAGRTSVEVRRPYRDRRLVELVLALPAHLLYRGGWRKWIMRSAMVGVLPEAVRLRWQGTSLTPLGVKGLIEEEAEVVRNFLSPEKSMWPRFVRPEWMTSFVSRWLREDTLEALVPWHCICMELWIHK